MFYIEDLVGSEAYKKADQEQRNKLQDAYYRSYWVPEEGDSDESWDAFQDNILEVEDLEMQKSDVVHNLLKVGPSLTTTGMLMRGEAPTPPEAENLAVEMARGVAPMAENIVAGAVAGLGVGAMTANPLVGIGVGFAAGPTLNEAVRQKLSTGELDFGELAKTFGTEAAIGMLTFGAGRGASRIAARTFGVMSKAVPVAEKAAEIGVMSVAPTIAHGEDFTTDNFIRNAIPAATYIGIGSVLRISRWGAPKMKQIAEKYGLHPEDINEQFGKLGDKEKADILKDPNKLESTMHQIARGIKRAKDVLASGEAGERPIIPQQEFGGFVQPPSGEPYKEPVVKKPKTKEQLALEEQYKLANTKEFGEFITPPIEQVGVLEPLTPKSLRNDTLGKIKKVFMLPDIEANTMAAILDARGIKSGRLLEDFYGQKFADIVLGGEPAQNALYQLQPSIRNKINEFTKNHPLSRDDANYQTKILQLIESMNSRSGTVLRGNYKTLASLDFSGECPLAEWGWNCLHCYATQETNAILSAHALLMNRKGQGDFWGSYRINNDDIVQGYNRNDQTWHDMGKVSEVMKELRKNDIPVPGKYPPSYRGAAYQSSDITDMDPVVVDFFNKEVGGLRMYSYGDFKKANIEAMDRVIADAKSMRYSKEPLKIKIITGQKECLERYKNEPHVTFNLSVELAPKFAHLHESTIRASLKRALGLQKSAESSAMSRSSRDVNGKMYDFDTPVSSEQFTPEAGTDMVFVYYKTDKTKYHAQKYTFKRPKDQPVYVSNRPIKAEGENVFTLLIDKNKLRDAKDMAEGEASFAIDPSQAQTAMKEYGQYRTNVNILKEIPVKVPEGGDKDWTKIDQIVAGTMEILKNDLVRGKWTYDEASNERVPGKVALRYTSMNRREFIHAVWDSQIDVVTPYHGPTNIVKIVWGWMNNAQFSQRLEKFGEKGLLGLASIFEEPYHNKKSGKIPVKGEGAFTPAEIARELGPSVDFEKWVNLANWKACCLAGECASCSVTCANGKKATVKTAERLGRFVDGEYRGSVEFLDDGRAIIRAFKDPDYSTIAHEVGHIFRRDVTGDLLARMEKYYNVKDGKWTVEQEELFGRDWERYVYDNTYPPKAMRSVFKQFTEWVTAIYKKLRGQGIDFGEEPNKFFDEMLGIEKGQREAFFAQAKEYSIEPTLKPGPGSQSAVEALLTLVTGRFHPIYDNSPETAKYGDNVKAIKQYKTKVLEGPMKGEHLGVFVTEAQVKAFRAQVRDYVSTITDNFFMNPIYVLDNIPVLKELYYRIRSGEKAASIETTKLRDFAEKKVFNFPARERENLGAFMTSLQADGPQRLAAMGIKDIKKLTPKAAQAMEFMRDVFNAKLDQMNHIRVSMGKQPIPKLDNYLPMMIRFNELLDMDINPVFLSTDQFMHPRGVPEPMAHKRLGSRRAVELDVQKIFHKYTKAADRIIQISPTIAQARLLTERSIELNGKKWRLKDAEPRAYKFLSEWLDNVAGKGKVGTWGHMPTFLERAMHRLNQNVRTGVMSFYLPSAFKQPLAYINTVADVGVKSAMTGALDNLNPARRNFAMNMSEVLKNREVDVSLAEAYETSRTPVGGAINVAAKYGFAPLRFLDMETARSTWLAGYDRGKRLGYSGKELVRFADDLVVRGQGSASRLDVSPAQRTELGRFLTLFQTFAIADWNHLRRDVLGVKGNLPRNEIISRTMRLMLATELANLAWIAATGRAAIPTPFSTALELQNAGEIKPEDIPRILGSVASRIPMVGSWEYGNLAPGAQYMLDVVSDSYKRGAPSPFDVMTLAGLPGAQQGKRWFRDEEKAKEARKKKLREMLK